MKKSLLTLAILTSLSLNAISADYKAGEFVFLGGATMVIPESGMSGVYVEALGGDTALSTSVDDNTQLGLNFVYFYEHNWAVKVLAATPFMHDITIYDPQSISVGLFGIDVDGATLAEVTQLPPTVSILYYFDSV